jgi:hypothetical protein
MIIRCEKGTLDAVEEMDNPKSQGVETWLCCGCGWRKVARDMGAYCACTSRHGVCVECCTLFKGAHLKDLPYTPPSETSHRVSARKRRA